MLSLRQSLATIGKPPPIRIPGDIPVPSKSLRDTLIVWNHIPYALLIIAPQEFVEAVGPLAAHKNNTGIPTRILSLEQIYQTYPGRDEAEKVKRCLALFQPNNGVRYAMLVGDEDKFPVRYVKWWNLVIWHPSDPEFHTLYFPVDLYYGALFRRSDNSFDDWDGDQNGYFGEVPQASSNDPINPDKVNVIPILAIGRIPASTVDEVKVYVSKVISYEIGAYGSSWAKAALLVATADWVPDVCTKQEDIAANYLQGFTVHKLYQRWELNLRQSLATIGKPPPIRIPGDIPMPSKSLRDTLTTWKPYPCQVTENPSPVAINAYMNQGVGFVSYIGHGSSSGWGIPNGGYNLSDIANLSNSGKLPIVFSIGCDTGSFATIPPTTVYQDINGNLHKGTNNGEIFQSTPPQPVCLQTKDYESMAEEMTVKRNTGAIAYIGSVITGHDPSLDLLKFFFEAVPAGCETLGDMWLHMFQAYYRKHAPPDPGTPANKVQDLLYFLEPWRFHLLGDPSLRVRGIPH